MKNKNSLSMILGIICLLISFVMIFQNTRISSFGFYQIGRVSTGGILIVLFILSLIFAFVKPSKISKACVVLVLIVLLLSLILGMHITFKYGMSALDVILMVIPLALGIALIIKAVIPEKNNDSK